MKRYLQLLAIICAAPMPVFAQLSFTPLNTSTTQNLLGISFADTSTGFACGDGGTIIKTTNGGASWTAMTTGTTQKLWDIKVIPNSAGQKIVAVGDNNTVIKSINGGSTWTAQSIPFQTGSFVFGIYCLDSLNYVACGGDYATFSGAVLRTTDGGNNWTAAPVTGSIFLDKIFMLNTTNGFSAGTNTSFSDGSIQKISGSTVAAVKTSSNIISNVWCNSATNIVAVGIGGQILRSTDGGNNWTSHDFNTTDLYGIRFTDSLHGYACGGDNNGNIILSTTNGGNTWAQTPYSFNGSFQSISIAGSKIFIAGDQGMIIKSSLSGPNNINDTKQEEKISVYPNPATDKVSFAIPPTISDVELTITDLTGKTVQAISISSGTTEIDMRGWSKGIYIYKLTRDGVILKTGKLAL